MFNIALKSFEEFYILEEKLLCRILAIHGEFLRNCQQHCWYTSSYKAYRW